MFGFDLIFLSLIWIWLDLRHLHSVGYLWAPPLEPRRPEQFITRSCCLAISFCFFDASFVNCRFGLWYGVGFVFLNDTIKETKQCFRLQNIDQSNQFTLFIWWSFMWPTRFESMVMRSVVWSDDNSGFNLDCILSWCSSCCTLGWLCRRSKNKSGSHQHSTQIKLVIHIYNITMCVSVWFV